MAADNLIGCFLKISSRGGTANYPTWDMLERARPLSVDKTI